MREEELYDERIKVSHFPLRIFILSFAILAAMTTVQNKILGKFINVSEISNKYVVFMALYWIFVSAVFTWFTRWQIRKRYEIPLKHFAKATREVADGDFSVYVRPIHTADKMDYLDRMICDFNKMVAELGSIETLKTDFFSNVSHEIKTPIAIIQNYAELLKLPDLPEQKRQECVDTIIQTTHRLSELITNILKLGKLEKKTITPVPEEYNLCSQLCECALNFEALWEKKQIEFEADLEDEAVICADADLMALVWSNLLSNAFKFTDAGGRVTLKEYSEGEEILVQVRDTGCGMSSETMNHIFDKFYQGDTSHATEGNGLGLALALRVLQLMGYTITAESRVGEGTAFTVHIPAAGRGGE